MSEGIAIALITGGLAVVSNIIVAWLANSKTIYRVEQLEKKVDKHNNFAERIVVLEQNDKAQWRYIDDFKKKLHVE